MSKRLQDSRRTCQYRIGQTAAVLLGMALAASERPLAADDEFSSSGERSSYQTVREELTFWLENHADEATAAAVLAENWPVETPAEMNSAKLHHRLLETLAQVDVQVQEIIDTCSQPARRGSLPDLAWLQDTPWPTRFRGSVALHVGRWLTQEAFYDQAVTILEPLDAESVLDPATLYFCRSVCKHCLVQLDGSQDDLALLQEVRDPLPRRYEELAQLMTSDATGIEDDSLDHIARRMDDIRRRLDQGSTNQQLIEVEEGVVESLDKLIKELEEQARQQQQQMAQQSGGGPSATPMQDSMPVGGRGPGNVERRDIGDGAGWGDLPEKDREAALHQVSRDFPAHYRQLIEQYFRRLAGDAEEESR